MNMENGGTTTLPHATRHAKPPGGARGAPTHPKHGHPHKKSHHRDDPSQRTHRPPHQRQPRERGGGGGQEEAQPSVDEVRAAVFAYGNVFEAGERVVVPRSRGGFTLGRISKVVPRRHCYVHDPSSSTGPVTAPHNEWRVVYKNSKGEYLFKDLPPASLGKLSKRRASGGAGAKPVSILSRAGGTVPSSEPSSSSVGSVSDEARNKSPEDEGSSTGESNDEHSSESTGGSAEGDEANDEELEGEIITFKGLHRSVNQPTIDSTADVAPNPTAPQSSTPPTGPSTVTAPVERRIGEQVIERDLAVVSFAPTNTFKEGELVVVPRSAGGFTYGTVQGRMECACPIGPPAHKHLGWRVNVDSATPKPNFKDIFSAHLGKLHLAEAPSGPPTSIIPLALTPATRQSKAAGGQRRKTRPSGQASAPAIDAHRHQRNAKYEFDEGESNGAKSRPSHGNQDVESDEYEFHYTSTSAPVLPPIGPGMHRQRNDEDDDEDYFEEYEDEEAPRPAVPTFSGLFSSSGAVSRVNRVPERKQEAPATAPRAEAALAEPAAQEGQGETEKAAKAPEQQALDTNKKGILSVPNMPTTPTRKTNHRNQGNKWQGRQRNKEAKPMIVIDGPNVAVRHGNNKKFSVKGLKIAIQYWERKGHQVVAFVPQHYLTRKAPTGPELKLSEFMPMADNINMLQELVDSGSVVVTPPQDYDDSYSIEYGKRHDAYIVTNDRYRDHVDKQPEAARPRIIRWLREHCISFTFVKDEFLPNPDFKFLPPPVPQEEEGK